MQASVFFFKNSDFELLVAALNWKLVIMRFKSLK